MNDSTLLFKLERVRTGKTRCIGDNNAEIQLTAYIGDNAVTSSISNSKGMSQVGWQKDSATLKVYGVMLKYILNYAL